MIAKLQEKLLNRETLLRKPFIVAGLGLTVSVALWNTVVPSFSDMLGMASWGAIALGAGAWWLTRKPGAALDVSPDFPSVIDRNTVIANLAEVKEDIDQFATLVIETATKPQSYEGAIAQLNERHQQLLNTLDRTQLTCAVLGAKGVGKTTLVQQLDRLNLIQSDADQPYSLVVNDSNILALIDDQQKAGHLKTSSGNVQSKAVQTQDASLASQLLDADLLMFVTEGDVTASDLNSIEALLNQGHSLLVVFNKQDRYLPTERLDILNRIRERLETKLEAADIIATSAIATRIKVRKHQADGTTVERFDENPVDISALSNHMQTLLMDSPESLVLKTTLRQAHQLRGDVRQQWNQVKRDRALPVIEKYQWIAAAAAFANPLPSLDLVATGAINAQLLADLSTLYDQSLTLEQAKVSTRTLAELMIKLGLVEVASQAIAPLLKTHMLTFAAGGSVQGLSAAYLTHIAGLSLIQYFEEQSAIGKTDTATDWNFDRLGQIMQQVVQSYQRSQFVKNLVDQGIQRFTDKTKPTSAVAAS